MVTWWSRDGCQLETMFPTYTKVTGTCFRSASIVPYRGTGLRKAHKELLLVIGSKRLLSDIRMLSPAEKTSMLEAQHKVACQFAPKFVSFSYAAMKQRLHLAALHPVSNAHRKHAETKNGEKRYRISYPKYKAGHHILKPVKEACNYDYVIELMAELLQLKEQFKSTRIAKQTYSSILFSPPPLASSAKKILKNEAVQLHRSRFN
ncbi:uncharacterized protein LOC127873288 [Dreissena polymorpha]|uniref:uncharacterized protein LOC127873288 n=1 Tax=Dreissena polymorpha TaxID=45954 RepID=UPI0022645D9A|nr:uncharacterized protein LOC127873288 [Dreissena polymorpha]